MRKFKLVTDSSSDLPIELLRELDVDIFPLHFYFDQTEYNDDKTESVMTNKEFYKRMREGAAPTTSAVSVGQIEEYFTAKAASGEDILYIAFSSGLSTSFNAGVVAAKAVGEKYPERDPESVQNKRDRYTTVFVFVVQIEDAFGRGRVTGPLEQAGVGVHDRRAGRDRGHAGCGFLDTDGLLEFERDVFA